MVLRGDLNLSNYLTDLYAEAPERWDRFSRAQGQPHERQELLETAGILCDGITRLREDRVFWGNLYELPAELDTHRASVHEALSNIEQLLAVEEEILVELLRGNRARATRQVTTIGLAIRMVHDLPSGHTIEN